jgi:glutamyl endopeptidase
MPDRETPVTNGHTPVSNAPEPGEVVTETQVSQPSKGEASEEVQEEREGVEAVAGYERTEAALARLFTAPDTSALRPIAEASFGPPPDLAEIVHGPDDRVQITNTSIYPWRVHASLLITAADNSLWIGTAWFIGPHTLMTAGHVVFINGSGVPGRDGWVRSIQVMPGRNGGSLPYGSVTSTNFRSVTGWTNSADQNYDYGAIIIPTELGNTVGWFGFGVWSDSDLTAVVANISGYPGDKPAGTQWYDWQQVASVDARKVYYDIDTAGGQSGSAVYRFYNGGRYGIAIHAYGGAVTNNGTRIVSPVYNNMVAWKA